MKLEDCIRRIDRYMHSSDNHPRLVNVQNCEDMNAICSHFRVGTTVFKDVVDYAKSDANPSESALFNDLRSCSGNIFITGFTTFYKLLGEQKLNELLKKLISFTGSNLHIVVMCFQCDKQLDFSDARYKNWVYFVDGIVSNKTELVFSSPSTSILEGCISTDGIQSIASVMEQTAPSVLYVKTAKSKDGYGYSLISISEQSNTYGLLCTIDPMTNQLSESFGSTSQWAYALNTIKDASSWSAYATKAFGSIYTLDLSLSKWNAFDENKKWMYFLSLKLFGASNSWCLNTAAELSSSPGDIIKEIYQGIFQLHQSDEKFWDCYNERKYLIQLIGKSDLQISDFCDWVLVKGKDAIYYLTDMSIKEINLIFQLLNGYRDEFSKEDITGILKHVYPDLYQYLQPYDYKNALLNQYFDTYKYQKVVNCVFPDFLSLVEEQAVKRDYNFILPSRCEKTESIDMRKTLVYFIDAMGVEYLSYIMAQCRKYNLMAYTTLCHCEIPSITSKNKDFVEVFESHGAVFAKDRNGIKSLDEIKHHGEEDFDFTNNTLPTHLAKELRIIADIIETATFKLQQFDRVVLISDHGASRLSVISKKENKHQMATNGIHSGRCCPKSESDIQPECAIDGDDFWVLANYDRFKGGRPANVEVHGGATLEEVVIPIIDITKAAIAYEFRMVTDKITFSKRKKDAEIKIYSKSKIDGITVRVSRIEGVLPATSSDGHNFIVSITDLKASATYTVDVYLQDNLVKSGLTFRADNSDFKEKKLL